MRIRRLSGAVALLGIAGLLASGCSSNGNGSSGSSNSGSGNSSASASTPSTTAGGQSASGGGGSSSGPAKNVTVWIQNGGSSKAIQDYMATWGPKHHINVTVDVQASDQYTQAITLALKTGKAPDVFIATKTDQLVQAGYVLALDDLVSADTKAEYSNALKSASQFIVNNKIYAMPTTTNTIRLAYNKDIFSKAGLDPNKPPTNFSEIESDCTKIAQVSGVYCFGLPLGWPGYYAWMLEPLAVAGSDIPNAQFYDAAKGKYDYSVAAPAVQLFRKMITNKWAYPGASSLANDPMRAAFAAGKIGMFVSAAWDIPVINDQDKTKANWAAAPLPAPDGQQLKQTLMNVGTAYSINAKTKDPKAAAEVLDALVGSELSEQLANAGLITSANQDVKITATNLPAQVGQYALTSTDTMENNDPTSLLQVTGDTVNQQVTKLILGSGDIASTLSSVQTQYNGLLSKAVAAGQIKLADYR